VVLEPGAEVVHEYRRRSAANPLSLLALRHLRDFTYFQRKWYPLREWRRREAARIERLDGRVDAAAAATDRPGPSGTRRGWEHQDGDSWSAQ
jgi:hypothetical protein